MAEVEWSRSAANQFAEVIEFIATDNPQAAEAVAKRIVAATRRLAAHPAPGHPIPEVPYPGYRQLWAKPCRVYYRVSPDRVQVLHVRRAEKLFRTEDLFED